MFQFVPSLKLVLSLARKAVMGDCLHEGSPCWNWVGSKTKAGYGYITLRLANGVGRGGRNFRGFGVHRVVYELHRGPVPAGMVLDHLCRNAACCNPAHLEPVTQKMNVQRGDRFGVHKHKPRCPQGHPLVEDNLRKYKGVGSKRQCKQCHRERSRLARSNKEKEPRT